MPSVTDIQQQSTSPSTTLQVTSMDSDALTQVMQFLEKKQRNLGKRKEKLESYQNHEKEGKELNKDQKEALAKYSDVLGQIEGLKEVNEQVKKIQTESVKNQKRLSKQAAEEKRQLLSQTLRQYAQIRYLVEHRSTLLNLQSEDSTLLDELSSAIIPTDHSTDSISRSIDTVLAIYQYAPTGIIRTLTGKNPQDVRDSLEQLINKLDSTTQQQQIEIPSPPPPAHTIEEEPIKEIESTDNMPEVNPALNDYPLQFDTRVQKIPLEQIIQDQTFFSIDSNHQINDENREPSPDPNQYIPTMTVVNSNINDQIATSLDNQQHDGQEQFETTSKQNRGRGNHNRTGQFNHGNKNINRRGSNHYYQQNRNQYGGYYGNSYNGAGGGGGGSAQRPYYDHTRGRGGYRGGRGGNYRYNSNENGYQNAAQHQNSRSAPPVSSEQRK